MIHTLYDVHFALNNSKSPENKQKDFRSWQYADTDAVCIHRNARCHPHGFALNNGTNKGSGGPGWQLKGPVNVDQCGEFVFGGDAGAYAV